MSQPPGQNANPFFRFWFGSVDAVRLDTFRMLIGIALLLYMRERWRYAREWLTSAGFHVSPENLPYHPLSFPLLSDHLLPYFGAVLFGSILLFILGWRVKWTAWVVLANVVYVTFADQISAFTLNKLFIAALSVLAFAPKGPFWSVRSGSEAYQSAWPVRILQITLVVHYFGAGWSKAIYGDWLVNPYALWSHVIGVYRTDFTSWLMETFPKWIWPPMQYSALAFELLSPFLLTIKRIRPIGLLWGAMFQTMIALTMHQFIYFMLLMFCFYVLFVPEEVLRRIRRAFHSWLFSPASGKI